MARPTSFRFRTLDVLILAVFAAVMFFGVRYTSFSYTTATAPSPVRYESGHPYRFLVQDGEIPAAWDCSTPITFSVDLSALAPELRPAVIHDLLASAATISANSSFRLVYTGEASGVPARNWGEAWSKRSPKADIAVAFTHPGGSDLLVDYAAASGGNYFKDTAAGRVLFAGYVVVDVEHLDDYTPGAGFLSYQALFTHELLHVINLDHVDDPESLMTERISYSNGSLGSGDRAALAVLSERGCAK
jgi:hypothetical protein